MAGLIPQTFIDDLLHRLDIVEVVNKRVSLKRAGKNYQACCPFHNEKTPSFSVQPDRQFYYCFGCGAGGNAIGFVMEHDQLGFPEAVEALARDAGLEVPRETSKAAVRRQSEHEKLLDCLEAANQYFQQQLRQHPARKAVIDYLKSRGLSGGIANSFGIGFAPPGWDNLLSSLGNDEATRQSLLRTGMIIERNAEQNQANPDRGQADAVDPGRRYYDRFRNRIMFPIRDSRGRTVAFGGRVLGDDKPKYLNSPETPVFHKGSELYGLHESRKSGEKFSRILLVEGYMDVIALAQMEVRNAVATLGTATSERHLTRLFRHWSEIIFCFDGDAAGRTAAWRALETTLPLMEDGRRAGFLFLPDGADPDSYIREVGKEQFIGALDDAQPLEQFFFEKLSREVDTDTIEGRARMSNLAKPLIRKLPKGVYAQLMLDRLSDTLGLSHESLDALLAAEPPVPTQAAPTPPPSPYPYPSPYQRTPRRPGAAGVKYQKSAAVKAIDLLLLNPEVALAIEKDIEPLRTAEDSGRQLLLKLIEKVQENPNIDAFTLVGFCYASPLSGLFTQLIKEEQITPQEGIAEEFLQILDNILADIERKLTILRLKEEVHSRISAASKASGQASGQAGEQLSGQAGE